MIGQRQNRIRLKRQQTLRKEMTIAERALWRVLQGHQLAGCKFRRQHPFEGYFLDFVCLEKKLVIEVDGGQHCDQMKHDEARTEKLKEAGFTVVRFWDNEVLCDLDAVRDKIWEMRISMRYPSPPLPSP